MANVPMFTILTFVTLIVTSGHIPPLRTDSVRTPPRDTSPRTGKLWLTVSFLVIRWRRISPGVFPKSGKNIPYLLHLQFTADVCREITNHATRII